jgi:hypothetical protein
MAYQFTIAFYEQGSLVQLVEGIPQTGEVSAESFDYYKFQLPKKSDSIYEITLTPKSGGNPDIVLSLNRSNKFPTKEQNDYISELEFAND